MADSGLEHLVTKAQFGDLDALDTVLRSVQGQLYEHIRSVTGDPEAAYDTLQRVLLIIARKLDTLADRRLLRAWCYRIATREAVRDATAARRDELRRFEDGALDALPASEDPEGFDEELVRRIPDLVDALPTATQLVVRMHYFDGLRLVDIAEALDIPIGTVKSRLNYGLRALRLAMSGTE